jgi:hypothetical protein
MSLDKVAFLPGRMRPRRAAERMRGLLRRREALLAHLGEEVLTPLGVGRLVALQDALALVEMDGCMPMALGLGEVSTKDDYVVTVGEDAHGWWVGVDHAWGAPVGEVVFVGPELDCLRVARHLVRRGLRPYDEGE